MSRRGSSQSSLQDLNKEFDKWVPDKVTSDSVTGTCDAKTIFGNKSISKLNASSAAPANQGYDYYVCGGKDDGDKGQCLGVPRSTWNGIWSNCKASKDVANKDTCSNMPSQNQVPGFFNVGGRTYCNDDNKYDPISNKCNKKC